MRKNIYKPLSIALLSLGLATSPLVMAKDSALPSLQQLKSSVVEAIKPKVDQSSAKKAREKRKEVISEAVTAIDQTFNALQALEENKSKEALADLEDVTGKLELILARDPELALAPMDVEVVTYDLFADLDTIKDVIEEAKDYMEDGEIQKARPLVENLASEMVFRTTSIPLATYPDAIKEVVPLIDEGKIEEAKTALQAALNTLVITTEIVPLPSLRAKYLIHSAEKLAETSDRTSKDNETLDELLKNAREQLKMGELLGYGSKKSYKPMYKQLDEIEKKVAGGKSGKGWFDKIKQQISEAF